MKNNLSIIIPVHNEVNSLEYVLKKWTFYLNKKEIFYEFILCEDGSTDGTKDLIIKLQKKYNIKNETSFKRRGYGDAVLAGISLSMFKYILCIDGDGQCMPDNFGDFWDDRDKSDFIIGIRKPRNDPFIRLIYSNIFLILHKLLFPSKIKDPSCPYVFGKRENFLNLIDLLGYMKEGFWWGFIGAAIKKSKSIQQINIKHYERYDGQSVVYRINKMPSIIYRNIKGLILLRFNN